MEFFNRTRPQKADFIAVRAEPPDQRRLAAEAKVIELDELIALARNKGDMTTADALLDDRNAIRPAKPATVPVNPGRTS